MNNLTKIHYGAYFDCAATTPVDDRVFSAMQPYFSLEFGNPGSLHSLGQKAQAEVDFSRQSFCDYLGTDFSNLIFLASASEANNLAIKGVVEKAINSGFAKPHLIISRIEHRSVLKPVENLLAAGKIDLDYLETDSDGIVKTSSLAKLIRKETVLVAVMSVNNETGAIQPIKELAKLIKEFRQEKIAAKNQNRFSISELQYPLFFSDSAQALTHLSEIKLSNLGIDLLSLSSHKIYGPKGAAVLVSGNLPFTKLLSPYVVGGSQEFGFRAGTENVPAIVGFAKALELGSQNFKADHKTVSLIRKQIVKKIFEVYPRAVLNSPDDSIAEILNFSFPGYSSEELIYAFDKQGVAVSAGSACEAKVLMPSHVLLAMGLTKELAGSVVRFSFGRLTKNKELEHLFRALEKIFLKK